RRVGRHLAGNGAGIPDAEVLLPPVPDFAAGVSPRGGARGKRCSARGGRQAGAQRGMRRIVAVEIDLAAVDRQPEADEECEGVLQNVAVALYLEDQLVQAGHASYVDRRGVRLVAHDPGKY